MAIEVPESVVRFITNHIDSASLLDALLLLRAAPEKAWTAEEVGRALVTGEEAADVQLQRLRMIGVARAEGDGVAYAPGEQEAVIDDLADCYAKRRHTVVGIIYGGGDSRAASTLADAFRIRRRKG